jgi:polar amino acid transport system substrate-binding protein
MTNHLASRRRLLRQLLRLLGAVPVAAALPARAAPGAPAQVALRMAVLDQMPWAGRDTHGRATGVVVDMAQLLASASGLAIDTSALPYARAATMLAHGQMDLMLAFDTGALAGLPPPLATIGSEDIIIVGRRGSNYHALDDLCGRTVGHLRRATFFPAFANAACLLRYEVNSYEQGLRMLAVGRIDAMLGVRSTIDYAVAQARIDAGSLGTPLVLAQAGLALYAAPQLVAPAQLARLRDACAQLRRQQRLPELLARHQHL